MAFVISSSLPIVTTKIISGLSAVNVSRE
jgi:hypothetical protein